MNPEESYIRLLEQKNRKAANELFSVLEYRLIKCQEVFDAACAYGMRKHVVTFFNHPHQMRVLLDNYGYEHYFLFYPGIHDQEYMKTCFNVEVTRFQKRVPTIEVNQHFDNAVMWTVKSGNFELVELLLRHPELYLGDIHHPAPKGNKVLYWVCGSGNLDYVERLLQDKRFMPSAVKFAIVSASVNGQLNVVERLLQDKRVNPAVLDNKSLRLASKNGHVGVVQCLMKDPRTDPSSRNNEALCFASEYGFWEVVCQLLQDKRVNSAARKNFPLRRAARTGHLKTVERLLRNPQVSSDSAAICDAFISACGHGHWRIVKCLLKETGVNPSARKNAAIRLSCKYGHFPVVKLLLEDKRVDPAAKQNEPLRKAVEYRHPEIFELLLKHPLVDPDAQYQVIEWRE